MRIKKIVGSNWTKYVIVDSDTETPIRQETRYLELSDAEERLLVLEKEAKSINRARDDDGHFAADDPATPDVNEAYEGGKAPKKKAPAKKKAAPKKKATKK
tara:strand:+ start:416 stop:718 length:303 start_codon:yes stop_codon:yes gene_type:complete